MGTLYHVWFSTKRRAEALQGSIAEDAKSLIVETARRTGIHLVGVVATGDHVHLLVAVGPGQALPSVMHQLKGASSRLLCLKYPEMRLDMGTNAFWQKGYGWHHVPAGQFEAVRSYIRTHHTRPLRRFA